MLKFNEIAKNNFQIYGSFKEINVNGFLIIKKDGCRKVASFFYKFICKGSLYSFELNNSYYYEHSNKESFKDYIENKITKIMGDDENV